MGFIEDVILFPINLALEPILKPLKNIINGAIQLVKLLIILLAKIPEILSAVAQILSPSKLINDIITGVFLGINVLFKAILNSLNIRNLFGEKKQNNGIFGVARNASNAKCLQPTIFRLILMILCPPLAIFMHRGISAFVNIIVSALLTIYGYYFPGLIYAMMIVLC